VSPPSIGQAGAALGTAAGQNLAAVGGGHALTEAMDLGAMTLLGLIGTNHAGTPPVLIWLSAAFPAPPPQRPRWTAVDKFMRIQKRFGYYSCKFYFRQSFLKKKSEKNRFFQKSQDIVVFQRKHTQVHK
jgi:hypothetical protein